MHQEFLYFGAMGLIERRREIELHSSHDLPVQSREQNAAVSRVDGRQNFVTPKCPRVVVRER